VRLTFVGCGDAFGSGGRFNTCFHVQTPGTRFLVDCGASSLVAMKSIGIDRNAIDIILITHFHGDHFGGIPYFILDAQFFSKRTSPLIIAGPEGLLEWYERVLETTFPGSSQAKQKFDVKLCEITPGEPTSIGALNVIAAQVRHGPPDGPFHAYRVTVEGKTIAYTGDTEWVDALIGIGKDVDLLIAEAYFYDKKVPLHLDLATLEDNLHLIKPKQLVLTHMNDDMLCRIPTIKHRAAEDGMVVEV